MRIIAGELRGKKLHCPAGRDIRPTADRLREAIFNILGSGVQNARVLDLFAGTGALAIEALSRGAHSAVLIDQSQAAVKLMQRNVAACRVEHRARVVRWDIRRNLNCLSAWPRRFDLVFLDPPYRKNMLPAALDALLACGALARAARLVAEHAAHEAFVPPDGLIIEDRRRYGRTRVTFLATGGGGRMSAK